LIREIQKEHQAWSTKNFGWDQDPSLSLIGVMEELGELAHAHLKQRQGIRVNEDHIAKARDAIGDILIYMLDYCNRRNFDMQLILEETWAEVKQRDWTIHKENGT
jgi:NTP pyrophosphatase (non-canonical NTP hydrolase)